MTGTYHLTFSTRAAAASQVQGNGPWATVVVGTGEVRVTQNGSAIPDTTVKTFGVAQRFGSGPPAFADALIDPDTVYVSVAPLAVNSGDVFVAEVRAGDTINTLTSAVIPGALPVSVRQSRLRIVRLA